MKGNFDICVTKVFKDEGGLTDDKDDSGGLTNLGITQKEVKQDVRTLTVAQAKDIYKSKYWDSIHCDDLPSGVDYTCFDYGVNSGIGRPRKALERFKDLHGTELIDAINNERTAFLKDLAVRRPKDQKFLKGWLSRVDRVRNYSHFLSAQKKDMTSGPASGVVVGVPLWVAMSQYLHMHPYVITGIAVGVGLLIWGVVHYIRNRNG